MDLWQNDATEKAEVIGGGDWHCGDGYSSGNCTWAKIVLFNRRARMTEVTATKLSPFSTRVVNVLT